jgi:hypothetical protein
VYDGDSYRGSPGLWVRIVVVVGTAVVRVCRFGVYDRGWGLYNGGQGLPFGITVWDCIARWWDL